MTSYADVIQRAGSLRIMTGYLSQHDHVLLAFRARVGGLSGGLYYPWVVPYESLLRPYDHGPFPTIADKRLCMSTYLNSIFFKPCTGSSSGCRYRMRRRGFIACIPC